VLGALLLVAAGAVFALSSAQRPAKPEIELPPSLDAVAEQYPELARLLRDSELDTVYKEFLVAYEEEGEETALEMARERGIVVENAGKEYVRLTLILDTEDNEPLQAQLEAVGVTVISAFRDQVEVAVPLDLVRQELASDDPGAIFGELTGMEHVVAVRLPESRFSDQGPIEGEGVDITDADVWHSAGITGEGLRIGVLDLEFEGYEALLGEELPEEVAFEEFGWFYGEPGVHGTACAEIVHEVAPGAELVFARYDGSDAAFGEAVDWLIEQDVDIVSHSAGGLIGPRDGSEWDAQLVDDLAADGILWVNAAGNEALSHHQGDFVDADGDGIHEFAPDEETLAIYSYSDFVGVALSWDDDWERPVQDYELLVYDRAGDLLASSRDVQSGERGQKPVEVVLLEGIDEDAIYAAVVRAEADRDVTFDIFVLNGDVEYPTAGYSVAPPSDAQYSLTVGAVEWADDTLAEYSSQGPTADGRLKPEISAPTGVSGVSYGPRGFDGTSASCPHVAGAAALVWQAYPAFTRQETADFLISQAVDLGPAGPDTGYGYGRLQFPAAPVVTVVPDVTVTPAPTGTPGPTATPAATSTSMPTLTPVDYSIPTPVPLPSSSRELPDAGTLVFAGGVAVLLLGCGGAVLLLIGGVGLLALRRRDRRAGSHPAAQAVAGQPQAAHCERCGAAVRTGARFCPVCGYPREPAPVVRHCPHCGAPLRAGGRFCSKCGQPVQ
jgi:subtilisin family serine protease/predicted nucleic acid-binding Zn ribbon protein